jgi:phosphatidylserine decarboxylase
MPITIHREGWKILFGTIVSLLLLNFLIFKFTNWLHIFDYLVITISSIILLGILQFFRNPKRKVLENEKQVICPADGKIVVIEEVFEAEYFNDMRLQVSVFMSPTNVHVNRNPISGLVRYVKYHPGKYLVAWHPKSSTENERNSVVIENDNLEILVRQIAGALARRIVNYLEEGDQVMQGKELGFIKFGSRVDMYLPIGTKVDVVINQKVKGGKTIIASLN